MNKYIRWIVISAKQTTIQHFDDATRVNWIRFSTFNISSTLKWLSQLICFSFSELHAPMFWWTWNEHNMNMKNVRLRKVIIIFWHEKITQYELIWFKPLSKHTRCHWCWMLCHSIRRKWVVGNYTVTLNGISHQEITYYHNHESNNCGIQLKYTCHNPWDFSFKSFKWNMDALVESYWTFNWRSLLPANKVHLQCHWMPMVMSFINGPNLMLQYFILFGIKKGE